MVTKKIIMLKFCWKFLRNVRKNFKLDVVSWELLIIIYMLYIYVYINEEEKQDSENWKKSNIENKELLFTFYTILF